MTSQNISNYSILKNLLNIEQPAQLKYSLAEKKDYYRLIIDFDREKYRALKDIPPTALSIPEQLLFNLIFNQPKSDNNFFVDKFYQEKLFFYLRDIAPQTIPPQPVQPCYLKYFAEINRQFCKIVIDLAGSGAASLKMLDKKKLSAEERVFISYLSNVPFNNGAFYFNQQSMGRLFYFLAKLDKVYYLENKQKVNVSGNFGLRLTLNKTASATTLNLSTQDNKKKLTAKDYLIIGDKNYAIYYADKFWTLSQTNHALLSLFQAKQLKLNATELANFLTEILPVLKNWPALTIELPAEVNSFQETIIEKEPTPLMVIKKNKKNKIIAELFLDYELCQIPFRPQSLEPYYQENLQNKKYLFKRNKQSEDWLHNFLLEKKFNYQNQHYTIEEDDFIDFFTYEAPALQKTIGLKINGENIKEYFFQGQELDVLFDFRESSGINWFEFKPVYQVKDNIFSQEEIANYIAGKARYLRLKNGELAVIPQEKFNNITAYLEGLEEKKGKYLVSKNNLYFLYSLARSGIKAQIDESLKKLLNNLENFSGIKENTLPQQIKGKPRHYQSAGYNWLLFLNQHSFHGILADDMGVGKTFQVLLLLLQLKQSSLNKKPSLIIAPTSVLYNWLAEAEKFTPDLKVQVMFGTKKRLEYFKNISEYDLLVTSYALIRNDLEFYAKIDFNYVILDEAQYIKNKKAQSTRAVKSLKSNFRLALTGTPIENRLSELWSIFDFLMPGFLSSYPYYRTFYESDLSKLKAKIKPFILRRTKQDVLTELPDKNEIDSFCTLAPDQEHLYLSILQSQKKELFNIIDSKGLNKSQLNILTALLKLRQLCCHPRLLNGKSALSSAKFELFKELIHEIVDDGHKVVVFTQFVQMLQLMKKHLEEHHIAYAYLDGSTKKRQSLIDNFNNSKEKQVFLCSLKAGGVGINLTAANYVIIYDPWWNPAVEQQAMDRVHRLGQEKKVFVYKLITKGTVEEKIMQLKEKKKNLLSSVIDTEKAIIKSITKEDLENLFSY